MRVIDYDQLDEWAPWIGEMVSAIAPKGLLTRFCELRPEYVEDALDHLVQDVGRDVLIEGMNRQLAGYAIRVFHGTRVTDEEERQIRVGGLRALKVADRKPAPAAILGQHPDWAAKASAFDDLLYRFGPGWMKNGSGRREDDSVHVCLSRAGLVHGCNHYLAYGAEVDRHIAKMLFDDKHGLDLLRCSRSAKVVSFTAPFPEAAAAANPYGIPRDGLPAILDRLVSSWAYQLSHPQFSVAKQRDSIALRFPAPIPPERIDGIEDIDDHYLQATYDRDKMY